MQILTLSAGQQETDRRGLACLGAWALRSGQGWGDGDKRDEAVFVLPCRDVSGIVDLFQQRVDLESIFNFKTKSVFDNFYSVIALGAIAGNFQAEGLPKQLSLSGVNYKGSENTKQKNFKIS